MDKKKFGANAPGTVENNRPVGSAGQPPQKMSKIEAKAGAIGRRLKSLNEQRGKGK